MNKKQNTLDIVKSLHSESKLIILSTIQKHGKMKVNDIVLYSGISRTNVSNHLNALVKLAVLSVEQASRERYYFFDESITKADNEMICSIIGAYTTCSCSDGKLEKK